VGRGGGRTPGQGRPYGALGEVMYELARKRNVRGPYSIAHYMKDQLPDHVPTGPAVAKWMYGDTENPERENMQLFADAFDLSLQERKQLAWVYAFDEELPEDA
jgi:hypothetical protein